MHGYDEYAYGMWVVVAFNIAIFLFFTLGFLKPRGGQQWRSMGVVIAFIVALFAEMYGFPLTIYLLVGWLGSAYPALQPFSHKFGHLWVVVLGGSTAAWVLVMGLSIIVLLAGYTLLSKGWTQIHGAQGRLVTDGIYAYVRHPQYTGLFLVILGFLIQWPTLLTVLMAPILVIAYVKLARSEERRALNEFGVKYKEYMEQTPASFFPPLRLWKEFLFVKVPRQAT
ncbi:MAG: isoprenylcysteine carboxylmethyltransferase family protein [Acidobacteria bacterium]|nr:MAG: isoprenylcysteine carboxylmethyltransferase family protein [Acidobacteriota bacterium]REJ98272.1 MAG: isoprenylcysteine carboxylmethyltransferase family protein [Acidobacteriota bacterium]REK17016.1 MAG: isoprenylcysteine carboxylmethyltransferase family protein [Acidobacteriota bacterium]REK42926.1 MAG: isoprenylcysteine carboxylmethyltransferase family protein [Acidobacteriota bacterium]